MTKILLTMPQPGETITEGLIISWIAKPGDDIVEGTPLVELETEKAVFEYESPFVGKLSKIIEPNGVRVKVGEPIAVFEVAGEKADHYLMLGIAKQADELSAQNQDASSVVPFPQSKEKETSSTKPSSSSTELAQLIKMSPHVKKLVKDANLSSETLMQLVQSDPDQRLTKESIETYLQTGQALSQKENKAKAAKADVTTVPVSAVRMRIAENMVLSKSKIPHAHTGLAVDFSRLAKYRKAHKDSFKKDQGINLDYLSLIFPALIAAIKKHPVVNASYIDKGNQSEIQLFNKIHLGIAVGTEHGLVIPVIKDIESLDFKSFNATLSDKIARAMQKKLRPDEVGGATLIFNNFGFFGTSIGVQVIQYPLAATLGMGVIEKRVVAVDDNIAIHEMCDFVLAFDHRIMDGRDAGLFLSALKAGIENLPLS